MSKKRIKTSFNFDPETDIQGEENLEPSQTVPDQTLSLQDLVNRFVVTSNWPKLPDISQFDTEDTLELPDLTKLTEIEKRDFAKQISSHITETQETLSQNRKKRKPPAPPEPPAPELPEK
jgi:hypothetical protein